MPDFGFWELILILLVALLVIGPKQLPAVAATMGHYLGRLQGYIHYIRSEFDKHTPHHDVEDEFKQISQTIKKSLSPEPQDDHLRGKTHSTKPPAAVVASHSPAPKATNHDTIEPEGKP